MRFICSEYVSSDVTISYIQFTENMIVNSYVDYIKLFQILLCYYSCPPLLCLVPLCIR